MQDGGKKGRSKKGRSKKGKKGKSKKGKKGKKGKSKKGKSKKVRAGQGAECPYGRTGRDCDECASGFVLAEMAEGQQCVTEERARLLRERWF